jgi:4-amino-4-deoxy-L-arabinose transferase-like glycosyltransferase
LRITPIETLSTPAEHPEQLLARSSSAMPRSFSFARAVEAALLVFAAVFFALHFVHLKSDFPNRSPWMDWAKYTDEGWYGDAAIRHYELGHWNVPGDFNPAAALPVWPALELVLFRFTGVSLVAARALTVTVFGLIMVCAYFLIQRWSDRSVCDQADQPYRICFAPSIAILVLAVSPFCYVFSRLAILEPLLILLTLAALLAASEAGSLDATTWTSRHPERGMREQARGRFARWIAALGLLLPLIVLTKTTGIFLFPAIFWMLWAAGKYRIKPFLRATALTCGIGILMWGAYYLFFVRPHFLIDYRYLFSANAYTGITSATFWQVVHDAVLDISWIGTTLSVLALIAIVGSLVSIGIQRLRENPLTVALLLWIFGYGAFLTYHANLQPRYYLVIAVPLTMLTGIMFDQLMARAFEKKLTALGWVWRVAALSAGTALLVAAVLGAVQTVGYVRRPEYGWWSAAQQVRDAVDREAAASRARTGTAHSRLVFSISGSDLSLMTGLPSICDDFGTMTLAERVATYRPGWFASWNDVEDDKMDALAPLFRLERVAAIPVFDDPDRNLLILYRLDPLSSPGARGGPGRRRFLSMPHRLRTKVGEQPSAVQLRH